MADQELDLFKNVCAGRYTLDIPKGSRITAGFFKNDAYHFAFDKQKPEGNETTSLISGSKRLDIWESRVERLRVRDDPKIQYITKQLQGNIRHLAYYSLFETSSRSTHMLDTYMLRDIPKIKASISSLMNFNLKNFKSSDKNYPVKYKENLNYALSKQEEIIYQPWPHKQLGICLNNEILINSVTASLNELFSVKWYNGKESMIELTSRAYEADDAAHMQNEIDSILKLNQYFANSKLSVANRNGRVIIQSAGYSPSKIAFTWIATDAKAGSTRFPYLEITGYVEMKDFPEIAAKGLNETDLAIGWLKSIQVRENGMVGTR
ncbi:hypothetical protein [Pelagibaculum spongiae]|uniref:Tle cognate immunity protein 4 C-terminal domain-containing protein n=1 Tax=Pelagibaculum spongiae TaxID=2080658 RepID=A0A2V1GTZ8_9GAMM|nr:hypothetical protein [Pelagibaculum spongiae]PVZ65648.1 hypothetical protein DC094_17325 [Pelagibaculum spongiae]